MSRVAAFFDMDQTLLTVNSGALWIRREVAEGRLTWGQYARGLVELIKYKLNLIDIDRAMRDLLATVAGERETALRERTERWYRREIADKVAPRGREALVDHRRAGHHLVLLTASSPYLAPLVADQLELDDWLSSRYEVAEGLLTGEVIPPLCYGRGKRTLAERFASEQRIDLDRSYFYSDSHSDLPMLERVGHPRVVNPDLRLRVAAWRRGWPTLAW